MRLLLDTHVLLWVLTDDRRLSSEAREMILAAEACHVSAASIWEIAIKAGLGKLKADATQIATQLDRDGLVQLPVTGAHAAAVATLPPHHADPFDRLLIAQAMLEPLRLLTADRQLVIYAPEIVLVI